MELMHLNFEISNFVVTTIHIMSRPCDGSRLAITTSGPNVQTARVSGEFSRPFIETSCACCLPDYPLTPTRLSQYTGQSPNSVFALILHSNFKRPETNTITLFCGEISLGLTPYFLCLDFLRHCYMVNNMWTINRIDKRCPTSF